MEMNNTYEHTTLARNSRMDGNGTHDTWDIMISPRGIWDLHTWILRTYLRTWILAGFLFLGSDWDIFVVSSQDHIWQLCRSADLSG